MRRALFSFFALSVFIFHHARAVVVVNGIGNTSDPGDGSPWDYVGTVGSSAGEYLGNGWVLTAAHVPPGTFTLSGTAYSFDGQTIQLKNTDNSAADMILFHLATSPNLPPLALAATTPDAGTQVDLIGFGRIAGSGEQIFSWTDSHNVAQTGTGYSWSPVGQKSWGTNKIDAGGLTALNDGFGTTVSFTMDFSAPASGNATTSEAMAAINDSGGGVFFKSGTTWLLAGMMFDISTFDGQPANTAIYGNLTYAANIATYRGQIAAVVPEPSTGALLALGALLFAAQAVRRARGKFRASHDFHRALRQRF